MFTPISIIAVLAFFVTLGVVAFEVVMLRKKKNQQAEVPPEQKTVELPDYQQNPQGNKQPLVAEESPIENLTPQPEAQAQQPAFQPREAPSKKIFVVIGVIVVLLLVLGGGGYWYLNSRQAGDSEITDATDTSGSDETTDSTAPSPAPTSQIIVEGDETPTPEVSVIIDSGEESDEESSDEGEIVPTIIASDEGSITVTLSVTEGPTSEATSSGEKGGTGTGVEELPDAGIIHQTLLLGFIAFFFIGIAFIL